MGTTRLGRTKRELIRDYTIYVAIGLAFVSSILWAAVHDVDPNWLILAWYTPIVFGFAIGAYVGWIHSRRFWTVIAVLHVIGYAVALSLGFPLRPRWSWVLFPAEIALIDAVLGRFDFRPRRLPKKRVVP